MISDSFVIGVFNRPVRRDDERNCKNCSIREKCMYQKGMRCIYNPSLRVSGTILRRFNL